MRLADKSGGYFIYASTVIKFIDEEYFSPPERLDQVLNHSLSSTSPDSTPFAELDKLYFQILSTCPKSKIALLKHILGYLLLPRSILILNIDHIAAFLSLSPGDVRLSLRGLRSLISFIPSIRLEELHLVHASFGDFLRDKARAGVYYIDSAESYREAFCNGFSLGVHWAEEHAKSQLPEDLIHLRWCLATSLQVWFWRSSSPNIDRLVAFVHERLEEGHWYSRFEDPGLSDETTLMVFELFMAITSPRYRNPIDNAKVLLPLTPISLLFSAQLLVSQLDKCTPATQELLITLRTLCHSVMFNYLSKLGFADSQAKRDHLWVAHTVVQEYGNEIGSNLDEIETSEICEIFERLSEFLEFHASDFPLALEWEDFSKYWCLLKKYLIRDYLEAFSCNPASGYWDSWVKAR